MSVDYLPVMISVHHPFPELEQWIADRFEMLNGRRVRIFHREDLPADALRSHSQYAKAWLWDVVPADTQRILYLDYDIVPLRALPEIPDAPFIAVSDAQWYVEDKLPDTPLFLKTGKYFNSGFFVARRDTRYIFDTIKSLVHTKGREDRQPYDQPKFNMLVQSTVGVTWLPNACNTIMVGASVEEGATAAAAHLCGMSRESRWVVMNVLRSALGMTRLP